ncbi:DoxX family membrane protein [uncultured Algibacter sp.]|uniref:DoxX family membrane protein n=1 Tax=uncultured Algibacter sp. TaxID=298659 RepID=UPI00262D2EF9|nr:DoxX family membrane protein [uncultured Algibacter sp.]
MKKYIPLVLRIIVSVILIQTLRFKFTAHPDSIYIFEKVGLEPLGRIGIGIIELIAGILLLIPKTVWIGATLTIGIIGGAIIMHLTKIGIEVNNDNGTLFYTAIITFIFAGIILYFNRAQIPFFKKN